MEVAITQAQTTAAGALKLNGTWKTRSWNRTQRDDGWVLQIATKTFNKRKYEIEPQIATTENLLAVA